MSKRKCKNCGNKIIEYPIYKGQEENVSLIEEGETLFSKYTLSKINWYNLIVGDWTKFMMLAMLIAVAFAYQADTENCRALLGNPCEFIEKNKEVCEAVINPLWIGENPINISDFDFDLGGDDEI